jgi:hypothetical protein
MSTSKLKLVLAELEAEVVQEALDLYVRARPTPIDHRFEYRYRAARSVLDSLSQATNLLGTFPAGDDETVDRYADRPDRAPRRERAED